MRYYFHLVGPRGEVIPDHEGTEVTDLADARAQVLEAVAEYRRGDTTDVRGWRLEVRQGPGSVAFTVALDGPLLAPGEATRQFPRTAPAGLADVDAVARSLRILIAEDEALLAAHLEELVAELGHVCLGSVRSGPEAVQAALEHRPDLVLMDIRLADGTDGIEAASAIKDKLGTRSLFITGFGDPRIRARALALEPVAFLHKPVPSGQLRQTLRTVAAAA